MRLIIQIPAYNEEDTLGLTLSKLPRSLPGVDSIEWLVIDDGSTDATARVARRHGVDHLLRFVRHRGLAEAFTAGLDAAVELGADIIVNTDADNQYEADDIPLLIEPILNGLADMVVGERPLGDSSDLSRGKKWLQSVGSRVVRWLSRTDVPDCTSGFRAIRREAALRLRVFGDYTYTLETLIHAGQKGMAVASVPVRTNRVQRPSRLVKSIPGYVLRSAITILRSFCVYQPFVVFVTPGVICFGGGFLLGLRYLNFYFRNGGQGHVQSLILASMLLMMGLVCFAAGILADLFSVTRKLIEGLDGRVQRLREAKPDRPTDGFRSYLRRRQMTLETAFREPPFLDS